MKYISMKMEPKGNRPPMRAMTRGRRYQARAGTGLGMRFTRQGLSGNPFQLRPTTCMCTDLRHVGHILQGGGADSRALARPAGRMGGPCRRR